MSDKDLKERYIDYILESVDADELMDMARCHLENTLPDDVAEMRQHCFDLQLDELVEDEYIDGNGRRQKSNECAICGDPVTWTEGIATSDGRLICEGCDVR